MSAPTVNYDRIRDSGDHIMPVGFPAHDVDGHPGPGEWLGHMSEGTRIEDAEGNRFLLMAHGPTQGTVVLRDRYRRMFYCDTDLRVWPAAMPKHVREALVIARRLDVRAESMGEGAWDCLLVDPDVASDLLAHLAVGSYEDPNPPGSRHTRVVVGRWPR